jgi:hypothetical protein
MRGSSEVVAAVSFRVLTTKDEQTELLAGMR